MSKTAVRRDKRNCREHDGILTYPYARFKQTNVQNIKASSDLGKASNTQFIGYSKQSHILDQLSICNAYLQRRLLLRRAEVHH